jgi:hypothetical protein
MGGRIKIKQPKIRTWQLLVILIPLLFIDATLLRQDHIRMTELRDAVLRADEEENDEKIASSLAELRDYVSSHIVINVVDDNGAQKVMFGTGPFYLEHQYLRAANKALEEAEASMAGDNNPYGNVYGEAGAICKERALQNGWAWNNPNFINCMLEEINKYPSAAELHDKIIANIPSTEMYRHNYASPIWTFSLSGFFILLTVAAIVVIFIRFMGWVIIRLSLLFIR